MKPMKSTLLIIAMIVTVMFVGAPIRAAEPDPEAIKLAAQIQDATHASALGDQMMAQMMKAFTTRLTQANPGKAQDIEDLVNQIVVPEFHDAMPELIAIGAKTYASSLSVDELKKILAFYQSDAGKIYVAKLPDLLRQQSANSQVLIQQVVVRIQEKMAKALQDKALKAR